MGQSRTIGALGMTFVAFLGCGEATGPGPNTVAGTYALASVDGCVLGTPIEECPTARPPLAAAGTMELRPDRSVTRTVQYAIEGPGGPQTFVTVGTYTVVGDFVILALRENAGASPNVWRPHALLKDGILTLRYPHPADGEIVEEFRRE